MELYNFFTEVVSEKDEEKIEELKECKKQIEETDADYQ